MTGAGAGPGRPAEDGRTELASIIQSSHDAIVGTTLTGLITTWNPAARRIYGYAPEEVVGRHVDLLVPPARRAEEAEILARLLRGERIERYQTERLRKDGTAVAVSLTVSPILDGGGAIVGIASVSRDLSGEQLAEARFRGLLEAAPDAMVCVDAQGAIALINAQAERLFGYRRDELLGQSVDVLVPEASRPAHAGLRAGYLADPLPRPMGAGRQLAGRRRDGTEFPAEISLSALATGEGPLVSVAIRDVTQQLAERAERERLTAEAERERLERQLHQSQRLESLGQLAGGVAHDFNNLLAVILNYAAFVGEELERAAREPGGDRWSAAAADLREIQLAAERATRLTHQLLAFGRREVVRPVPLNLNDVVRNVEQLLRRAIGEDVLLVASLDPGLWPVVADAGQLEQVLVNLAVNARDAMPGGGTITIDTANFVVDDAYSIRRPHLDPGRYVRLRVNDTGVGMEPETLAHVFEPFFTTKPKGEGSGLGLATVYGIVAQAGGSARIYSEPGLGTTFTALFPATEEPVRATAAVRVAAPPSSGETVLVVEDEDAMREVTRRILTRSGYRVLTAASGEEAVACAAAFAGRIDLLVSDVVMPGMLGKEVASRLREARPELRVLFMSGYARPVLASKGTLDEGVTLLEKPFSEATLLTKVRELLDP